MARKGARINPKQWDIDVEQALLFRNTIVANLNECYELRQNGREYKQSFTQAQNDVQELFNLVLQLRKDLEKISANQTRYGLSAQAIMKKRQNFTDLENKVNSLRIAINEGAGKTKPVLEEYDQRLNTQVSKGNATAREILKKQEEAKRLIDQQANEVDKLVQNVHKQVLDINAEIQQHNLVLDDLEIAVTDGQDKLAIGSRKAKMLTLQNNNFCKLYCVIFILTATLIALIANKAL